MGSPSLNDGREKGRRPMWRSSKGNAEGAERSGNALAAPPAPQELRVLWYAQLLDNIWRPLLPGRKVLLQLAWPTNRIPGIEPPRPWAKHRFPLRIIVGHQGVVMVGGGNRTKTDFRFVGWQMTSDNARACSSGQAAPKAQSYLDITSFTLSVSLRRAVPHRPFRRLCLATDDRSCRAGRVRDSSRMK